MEVLPRDGYLTVGLPASDLRDRPSGSLEQRRRRPGLWRLDSVGSRLVGFGGGLVGVSDPVESGSGPEIGDELVQTGVLDSGFKCVATEIGILSSEFFEN